MLSEPILIVEDNHLNLRLVEIILTRQGYDVLTAPDAEEALKLLERAQPALILTDLQLPGMDGLELTRRLKANPATSDIVILALTAHAMKGDEGRVLAAGCDGYLSKPIDARSLSGIIAGFLDLTSTGLCAAALSPTGSAPTAR